MEGEKISKRLGFLLNCRLTTRPFLQQVKDMKMSLDDDKNSLLALAMAGKSAAVFDLAKACLEHDLNPKEV